MWLGALVATQALVAEAKYGATPRV